MAYQGISPYLYRNNLTNVQILDDISGSFNGTTTQFNLTSNGALFHAVSARSLLIILGGIVQKPGVDYTVSAGVITFTTAPVSGLTFSARNIYGLNQLTGINDGLVTPAKLSSGAPSWNIDGDLILSGDAANVYFNTDTPTVRPTLDLNFERDRRLDSRITYSRASTATYRGSDGLIKTVLANEPRFDFDASGNCLGLLIEESRTNLHLHSENLSNWIAETGASITSNAYVSPDGTQTADGINGTTGGSSAYLVTTLSNATTYTFSVFLKYISGEPIIQIEIGDSPFARSNTRFNVQTGTLVSNSGGAATVNAIENYGNGWYRYSITRTTTSSGGGFMDINHLTTTPSTVAVWGAQIEVGNFPTSYIPTTTSSVTRSSDLATISGTNFTSWYNNTEGTAFVAAYMKNFSGAVGIPTYAFKSTSNSNYYYGFSRDNVNPFHYVNTSDVNSYLYGSLSSSGFYKASLGLKQNNINSYINGIQNYNTTSVTLFTPNILYLGGGFTSSNILNGHISRFVYYPYRFSNTQLQNITS